MEASFSSNKPYMLRAIYEWIVDNDATPYILVDATKEAVSVPEQHIQNGQIVLNVEPNAIQNWFSDNDAISFSARFSGKAMNIFIPMNALLAIYAQENGLGMAFPPEENLNDSSETSDSKSTAQLEPEQNNNGEVVSINAKRNSHLKVIK